jgi:exosortase J
MASSLQIRERASFPDTEWRQPAWRPLLPWLIIGFSGLLLVAVALLWRIWTADALRSIGMYFPIVSVVLILRIWRGLDWETRGSWWGLLPLYYAVIMAREGGNALQAVAFTPRIAVTLLPLGLTVFAYASGVVLLLGGARVWCAALFPIALLLFVNPVPKAFELVDLPLQFVSAHAAQSFALAIGVHPDVNQLRLMFAPGFGMFIAPGCDGIRGAVTLGYLALILGYLYRFSMRARTLGVIGAVALAYVFNLIRLCFLVLFYRLALSFPGLQPRGEGADYLIGGLLFLSAATLFALIVRSKQQGQPGSSPPDAIRPQLGRRWNGVRKTAGKNGPLHWQGAVLSLVTVASCFSAVRELAGIVRGGQSAPDRSGLATADVLPEQIGKYRLQRTWSEQDWLSHLAYRWGAYSNGDPGNEIDVALWLGPGVHYPIACHISSGERPAWEEVHALPTGLGGAATFAFYFYNQPEGQTLEATTICDSGGCNEHLLLPSQAGFAFAGMGVKSFFFRPTSTPLPIVIRTQSHDPTISSENSRRRMFEETRDFISALNTYALIRFAASRNR